MSLSEADRALAQRLIDEIDRFNMDATGIRDVHEFVLTEYDDGFEVVGRLDDYPAGHTQMTLRKRLG